MVMVAIMHCPNYTILVLKVSHLGGGDTSALSCQWPPFLERSLRPPLAVQLLGKAHEDSDSTAVIAVIH